MKKINMLGGVAIATFLVLGATQTHAAMVAYKIGDGGLESFNLSYNDSGTHFTSIGGALAGGIAITKQTGGSYPAGTGFPASYVTVCTDIGASVYLGSTYTYDQTGFSGQTGVRPAWGYNAFDGSLTSAQLMGEQQEAIQNAANIFYNNFSDLAGSSTTLKAALQLAVWAAVYDTGISGAVQGITSSGGHYHFSTGRFQVSSGDQTAIDTAAGWLLSLNGSYNYTGNLLFPDPNNTQGNGNGEPVQELLIRTQDAPGVPEPATMLAGLLLLLPLGVSTLRVIRGRVAKA